MIEEPYRWVEAIATRRDYVETQLSSGSPVVALTCAAGILLFTVGEQKLFEIYDRIALGAIGHPGDIERLRMAAIELASTEGFTRSTADVSLRRLAYYSLSPVMKNAFEQIYGAPFLARLLFAEIGAMPEEDLFLTIEYDGAIAQMKKANAAFAVLAGTKRAAAGMETFLSQSLRGDESLREALALALDAWNVGQAPADENAPAPEQLREQRQQHLNDGAAALLERNGRAAVRYRTLVHEELSSLIAQQK